MNIVIRFDSVLDGTNFNESYEYPCSFIVDDKIYDKFGNLSDTNEYLELNINSITNVISDSIHFKEGEICYDGDNLFIYKGED